MRMSDSASEEGARQLPNGRGLQLGRGLYHRASSKARARREAECREIRMPEQAAAVMVGQLWRAWSGRGLANSDQ